MTEFISKESSEHNRTTNTKKHLHPKKPKNWKHPASTPIPYTMQGHPEDSFLPIVRTSDSCLPLQLKTASRTYHDTPATSKNTVCADSGTAQTTLPAVIQCMISVDATDNSKPPVIGSNSDRDFRNSTRNLYKGASIAHVIPFAVIQDFMKAILTSAVDLPQNKGRAIPADHFDIDTQKKGDMRRLVKSIIPSAGYQFDFHEEADLARRIQAQQESAMNITEQLFPLAAAGTAARTTAADTAKNANSLLNDLNNSIANLRTGYKDTNELIENHLDPIASPAGGSTLSKVHGLAPNAPATPSFRTVSTSSGPEAQIGIDEIGADINELSLAKRMHKLGRLRETYKDIEVYGILHTQDNSNPALHSFQSSEEDIGTTRRVFDASHSAVPALTKTAHVKNSTLQKSEYEFAGHTRTAPASTSPLSKTSAQEPEPRNLKAKSFAIASFPAAIAAGTAAMLSAPLWVIAGTGLLTAVATGGIHYARHKGPRISREKAAIEETKYQSVLHEMTRLGAKAPLGSVTYQNLTDAFDHYKSSYDHFKKEKTPSSFYTLNQAWKEFHKKKIEFLKPP